MYAVSQKKQRLARTRKNFESFFNLLAYFFLRRYLFCRFFCLNAVLQNRLGRINRTACFLLVCCDCVRSRHLVRCLLAAKGAAWLRPWLFCRILRASKHSSKAAARGGTSSLPAAFRKCYETSAIWFVYHEQNQPYDITDSRLFYMENLYKIVPWKTQSR